MRQRIRGRLEKRSAEIIALYLAGKTAKEVAEAIDANVASVNRLLERHGIPRKENPNWRGRKNVSQLSRIKELHHASKSPVQIAKILNISRTSIARLLRKNGIKPHVYQYWTGKTGASHVQWKGGRVEPRKLFRNSVLYKKWRNQVFSRDGYSCMQCGRHGVYLEAHHIIPLRDCFKKALAVDPLNGITLCRSCHAETKGHEYDYVELFKELLN